ncbi:hypothetical protein, partial [Bacteroides thetaiotaomicron]|uniref:hypothetical protein n=1 Tax=Bacteroides thetaiotaomicron TaxID=818 RepID=UPI001CE39BE6
IQNHYSFVRFAIAILFYTGTLSGAYLFTIILGLRYCTSCEKRATQKITLNCPLILVIRLGFSLESYHADI